MRTTKWALGIVVTSIVAFVVPVTSASADDRVTGGCDAIFDQNAALGTQYQGYIYELGLAQDGAGNPDAVTSVECWLAINGYEQYDTYFWAANDDGVLSGAKQISFTAYPSDTITVCQTTNGSTPFCHVVTAGPSFIPNNSVDTMAGGCGSQTYSALTAAQQGYIWDASFSLGFNRLPSDATVQCWIDVNGYEASGTRLTVSGHGVQEGDQPISFTAKASDTVSRCEQVTFTDGSPWTGPGGGNPDCTAVLAPGATPFGTYDTFTGGCHSELDEDAFLTGSWYEGVIYDASYTQDANHLPSGATVKCWIDASPGDTLLQVSGTGIQAGYLQVKFQAGTPPNLCQSVTFADNSPSMGPTCTPVSLVPTPS